MDLEQTAEATSPNLSPETTDQKHDTMSTNVSPETTGQVATLACDAALTNLTLSDSDLSSSDQQTSADSAVPAATQYSGSLAQHFDNIYESDPENKTDEELADYTPDVLDSHTVTEMVYRDQQSVPYVDYRETLHPCVSNYVEPSWLTDIPVGHFPKPILDESLRYTELTTSYWQNGEKWSTGYMVPPGEEVMIETLHKEESNEDLDTVHNGLQELLTLRSSADSAVQTDCVTVDAGVSTDQDVERYMNEVTGEREVLKDRYQEVLDRQTQMENQLQVKIRRLQQRQEEEENIYQENVKQIQEMKVKLEELKKKSEKEKKEFVQKEQELKNEVERLYENGKRLMREQEEKGKLVAILISDQSEKKEKFNEDLAKLKVQHNELHKNILEETERALKAEVQSLESKREIAVMMLDQAANEAEVQICNLSSVAGNSNLAREWQGRLNDIQVQMENIKNQYKGHIQMVKNGAKLNSLPRIQSPTLPPAPAEPDLLLQRMWQVPPPAFPTSNTPISMVPFGATPLFPPPASFFPSSSVSVPPSAPFLPVAFYPRNLPTAAGFPPGLGANSEFECHGAAPPASKPAAKLEKLLEKLEAKFPNCSRAQLTHILQQIKTSRGTIAGLSVDELMHQMAERLSETEQPRPLGPLTVSTTMPGYFPPAASQTSPHLSLPKGRSGAQASHPDRPALVLGSPRLCLMCQEVVRVSEVHPMACTHIVHKECIKFWAQTNKNSSCPFCPAPR
ncbi:RING finger protein 214-like [Heptranchias perlo]|uniref:RING finger protein 214-like n=1 Tax=Heptranchias perlo TaxID=212740 RepID=UPI00355A9384